MVGKMIISTQLNSFELHLNKPQLNYISLGTVLVDSCARQLGVLGEIGRGLHPWYATATRPL